VEIKRKPPVVAIRGSHRPDLVSQDELRKLAELQAAEWRIGQSLAVMALEVQARIAHGATVEDGPLVFDRDLKMARRGKVKAG
jgi:hypothetical protein